VRIISSGTEDGVMAIAATMAIISTSESSSVGKLQDASSEVGRRGQSAEVKVPAKTCPSSARSAG